MGKIHAVITGVGGYVPTYILDNDEMSHIVETSDEWIMERIGVKTRHILKPEEGRGTSYLMTRAVRQLLEKTQADPDSDQGQHQPQRIAAQRDFHRGSHLCYDNSGLSFPIHRFACHWQHRSEEGLWL